MRPITYVKAIWTACTVMAVVDSAFAADLVLPEGYAPLDWIESTGGQYIDTGVNAGANTTVDMSFGHCTYVNHSALFGKDIWNPKGWLFIMQHNHFRFFGANGSEPGAAWNLIDKDSTGLHDYRFTLGADNTARMFDGAGVQLCALATDRSGTSNHSLWLFKCDSPHAAFGQFRLYAMKIGTDAGETLRDFVPARRMNDKAVGLYDRVTKRFFANVGTGAFLAPGDQPPRGRRWSLARAREWGRTNPWYRGFNHVPAAAGQVDEIVARRSPAPQPYAYVAGGKAVAAPKAAVDPMAGYAWDSPKATDRLQIYAMTPAGATDKLNSGSFTGLDTAPREKCDIRVNGTGTILVDFGVELPAWLEFDSPDLSGDITCAVSEYSEPYSLKGNKTRAPQKVGEKTYRLVLNKELYEGVRFAFINVRKFGRPFTITAIRAVTQVMPVNYTGAFASDNPMLDRIWYVAAWDVRANIREDCFGAVLMARGDRYSWTGDAYPAQAASLVAFSNYDAVLKNLRYTECHSNRIESYELYWVESLIDYYMYSGDAEGVRSLVPHALKRLDHALEIVYDPRKLGFFGWDERTGIGFDHPDCPENRRGYQMLTVGALKHFADVLDRLGERETAAKYRRAAREVTARLLSDDKYISRLGMHSSADAINADLLPDISKLYHRDLSDRLQRLSYSPFNQHMLLKAMSKAGHYGDALASVVDLWGGQVEYGATCFLEVYRPSWNKIVGKLGPLPFTQCGHTSLAHPWGAGVLQWLTEEMLGIKPTEPGFSRFAVKPHFEGRATRVSGHVATPHGRVEASFDLKSGRHSVTVPKGTVATVAIPKEGMSVKRFTLKVNGGKRSKPRPVREDGDFLCLDDLTAGKYDFSVEYEGEPRKARQEEYVYAAKFIGEDRETHGEWYRKYGKDGYFIAGGGKDKSDLAVLPDYVESVTFDTAGHDVKRHRTNGIRPLDPRAKLPVNRDGSGPRVLECYHSLGLQMCPVDIRLKSPRRFRVALYVADCWQVGPFPRSLNFDAFDLETLNRVAPSVRVDNLAGGVYVIFEYGQSIRIRGNNIRGDNAIINAVFFDPCSSADMEISGMENDEKEIRNENDEDSDGGGCRFDSELRSCRRKNRRCVRPA